MTRVVVSVPGLLTRFTDGQRAVTVDATTLTGCVSELLNAYPAIEVHLFDGKGALRSHVHLLHDGRRVEWPPASTVPVEDGDEVVFLQAVSGGSR